MSEDRKTKPAKPLSPQREAFARAVADGKSQAEAYREAYPKSKAWKPETVWSRASVLMRDSKVSARVDELKKALAELSLWTREEAVRALREVIAAPDKRSDVINAVKELNAMHGYKAAEKLDVSGGVEIRVRFDDGC